MDKKEFAMFSMALKTYYPREQLLPNQQAMDLWYKQLQDIPFDVAELALNKWVAQNKWSPSIADIREQATSIKVGNIPDWSEAWEDVMYAIHRYGSYGAVEAMESFNDLTRQVVKRLGFTNLCMSENIAVERANFRTIYENLAQRKLKDAQLPDKLVALIDKVSEQSKMIEVSND